MRSRGGIHGRNIDEALDAAGAIGVDRQRHGSDGRVVPESFTQGGSDQRRRRFRAGFSGGEADGCGTSAVDRP